MKKVLLSISEFQDFAGGISRTGVYQEIKNKRLKTIKIGRRRLIPYRFAEEWLASRLSDAENA